MSSAGPSRPLSDPPDIRFRKKPVVIEAVRVIYAEMLSKGPECWPFEDRPEWLIEAVNTNVVTLSTRGARDYAVIDIHTLEGTMAATPGDYIIRGVKGELYPCKPDIFAATYEPVQPSDPPAPAAVPGEVARLRAVLEQCREYLDDRADVIDGEDGPRPDAAMSLLTEVDAALASSGAASPASPMMHREQHLASAMRKMLPPALLAEVIAHLDPLTPFVEFLRSMPNPPAASVGDPQTGTK